MRLTLGQIADWIHAEGDFDVSQMAVGYSIDSRTVAEGELFFAVRGERMDGHDFVEAALANGAIGAVVSMRWLAPAIVDEKKLLRVPDSDGDCVLASMQRLANRVRHVWGGRVIGVTGSAGKTTTKECIAAVLAKKFEVLKTTGNLNNHFGVPLQLLRLEPQHEVAVLEMGMNHAGEITALAKIAEPNWAVVSNVAPVHLEFFPDGIAGIARAKYELVESLPPDGYAILNGDDERVAAFARGLGERALLYGTVPRAYVRADEIRDLGIDGTHFVLVVEELRRDIHLHLIGRHNVLNALAAISVGLLSDIDIDTCCAGVEEMRPTEKRGRVIEVRGARLIDDTYNSNPKALASMVEALRQTAGTRRIVVAGEMLELGPDGPSLHRAVGEQMTGIDVVIGVRGLASEIVDGARSAGVAAEFVESPGEAAVWLEQNLCKGDVVLLKASRGVHLERALEALQE
ncbi:MAG TPA: UDP-N-acetylmuramoyl-tripeptide--D-alanyl-D-alanine ligase [Candidatus Aquilonibacter sp.]|nr:UDP-N-acetylmuramoyl-tripeptide--D-alanyl-D-alanine ligase [Candidatus Aquilonibacter sp.]